MAMPEDVSETFLREGFWRIKRLTEQEYGLHPITKKLAGMHGAFQAQPYAS